MNFVLLSCNDDDTIADEKQKFVSIFDDQNFAATYSAIDVAEIPGNGYLVLANKRVESKALNRNVYLIKADEHGAFINDYVLDDQYISAIPGLTLINGKYFFFAMSENGQANLVGVSSELEDVTIKALPLAYPAASSYSAGVGFLLLSYDQTEKKTVVSKINAEGNVSDSRSFKIADDDSIEDVLMQHFLGTGRKFPFSVGRTQQGHYYFNGFYDYTFSLVFTPLTDDNTITSVVYGQHDDGGISALLPMDNNKFAGAFFNFGSSYFNPAMSFPSSLTSIKDITGHHMRELIPNAPVIIRKVMIKGEERLIFGTETRSKQIGLFFYSNTTAEFLSSRYIGFSNPYEIGNIHQSEDGGLVICGTTYIAGRFPRIFLVKISKAELENII